MTDSNATKPMVWLIVLILSAVLAACTFASDSDAVSALYDRQKLGDESALNELEAEAAKGGSAAFYAGLAFQVGPVSNPARKDRSKAKNYYKQAKNAAANHNLALILLGEGKGEQAVEILREYADSFPASLMLLGKIHSQGLEGAQRNYPLAYQYFDKVVKFNKDPQAEYECALLLYTGKGIEMNTDKAIRYWESSAKFGNIDSKKALYSISTGLEKLVWMEIVIDAQPSLREALESKVDYSKFSTADLRLVQQRAAMWVDAHPTRNSEMAYLTPVSRI